MVVVCENCLATILQHRQAEMRSRQHEAGSLDCPVRDGEGKWTRLGATICQTQPGRRTGHYPRSDQEASDLVQDTATVMERLPDRLRRICQRLKAGKSKAAIARDLGMSQGAFYGLLRQIRAHFERAGLRDYLA